MSDTRCLIVGPSWVGDMVMAQSLFKRLRRLNPDMAIDVVAPAWSEPLLARMPEVRTSIVLPVGHGELKLGTRWRLGRELRGRYDRAIVLPNSLKSALLPFFAGIPRCTGYVGEQRYGLLNDIRRLDKLALPMTVQRYAALADDAPVREAPAIDSPRLVIRDAEVDAALSRLGLRRPDAPVLALCPGAEYGPAKRWPAEYFAEVADYWLHNQGQVWLFGSGKDQEATAEIMRRTDGRCVDLAGKTKLAEAIDLLSLAEAVVSNDSGLMHVAAAVDRPVVALYGSSDPGFTPPLSDRAQILSLGLDCSPCFQRECPLGHLDCLRKLMPSQVVGALQRLTAVRA